MDVKTKDDSPFSGSAEDDLRFSRQQGYFDKSIAIRLLIGSVFFLGVFIFLHYQELHVETLSLNSVAPRELISQIDFSFPDEEATLTLRQEALREVGHIYKLEEQQVRLHRQELEKVFAQQQVLNPALSLESMTQAIDLFEDALLSARFTDRRTIDKMEELSITDPNYAVYETRSPEKQQQLPDSIWHYLQAAAFSNPILPAEALEAIVAHFAAEAWRLDEDIASERILRRIVQASVPIKYTSIASGKSIIEEGEKVSPHHLVMLEAMKNALRQQRVLWKPASVAGSALLALVIVLLGLAYLRYYQSDLIRSNRKLFLLVAINLLTLLIAKAGEYLLANSNWDLEKVVRYPLFIPFAAMLLTSLLNARIAAFSVCALLTIMSLTTAFNHADFFVVNLIASFAAILAMKSLRKRKEVLVVCLKVWLVSIGVIVAFNLYQNTHATHLLAIDLLVTLLFMLGTAVAVMGLLPLFETAFDVMTDISLMEYMDPSHPIIQRLMLEAPGTYQHSLLLGNLAEAAALAIGANGLFCRVATNYHDIGKLANPQYFTENQLSGINMHQLLTPLESAQVIISHVSEGVSMARKMGLPEQFIDIIKEHHGTSLVYYFYHKQVETLGGDKSLVNERDFRYVGPKPRSKESAIMMLADTFEAASRTLEEASEPKVTELLDLLIKEKADDGQFDDCALTFEELQIVKRAMVKTIMAAAHARVKYPSRRPVVAKSEVPA